MNDSEVMYSASQVQADLALSPQMAGIYYRTLEKVSGKKIKTAGRNGREFDAATRQILLEARDAVRSNSSMTVSEAVNRAVRLSQMPLAELESHGTSALSVEALKTALSEAQEPVIEELRLLRAEVRQLQVNQVVSPSASVEEKAGDSSKSHGLLVRAALWVEGLLKH